MLVNFASHDPVAGFDYFQSVWNASVNPRFVDKLDGYARAVLRRLSDKTECRDAGYETPCWIWTGALVEKGYSRFKAAGKTTYTHRHAYTVLIGAIPDGLQLDHLCRNTSCCNPLHLEAVSARTNSQRMHAALRREGRWVQPRPYGVGYATSTHCVRGHEFTPDNISKSRKPYRICKTCERARGLIKNPAARAAKRAARTAVPRPLDDGSPVRVLAADGEAQKTFDHGKGD